MGVQHELLFKKIIFLDHHITQSVVSLLFLCQTNSLDPKTEPQNSSLGFSKVLNNPNFSFTGIQINDSAFFPSGIPTCLPPDKDRWFCATLRHLVTSRFIFFGLLLLFSLNPPHSSSTRSMEEITGDGKEISLGLLASTLTFSVHQLTFVIS